MKKMHSKKGATLLLALLLLLASTMVSTVILTAVTSITKNIRNDRELQQDYLTVSSAAEFLRDNIAGDSCKLVKTTYSRKIDYSSNMHKDLFKAWLDECVDYSQNSTNYGKLENEFSDKMTINVESDKSNVEFAEVNAEFYFSGADKKLTITLSSGKCTMYVIFECDVKEEILNSGDKDLPSGASSQTTTTITWINGSISRTAEGVLGNS